mmetsp:Transcript_16269/g.51023  ORF Transcript_16269/g.51023 Transcript_16269/m.51023 type:complete len:394 (-) Transcript_16269:963-2144(-)
MDEIDEEWLPLLPRRRRYRRGALITAAAAVMGVGVCGVAVVGLAAATVGDGTTKVDVEEEGIETLSVASAGLDLPGMGLADAGCAYKSSIGMVACYNVSDIVANANVSVDLYLPENAESLVVVMPGSGWCGLLWSSFVSETGWETACKLVAPSGYACAVIFYGDGAWPRQHYNAMAALNWTRTLGYAKTGLIGDSSGAGIAFYSWARANEMHLPVHAAGMIGTDVYLCPLNPPHPKEQCFLYWSKTTDYDVTNYPYTDACVVDVGSKITSNLTSCEAEYTVNCNEDYAREMLALHYITSDASPIIFGHGAVDTCIECENSVAVYEFVQDVGVDSELHVQPNASHIHYWAGAYVAEAFMDPPFEYNYNSTEFPSYFIPKILDFFEARGIPSSAA